MAEKVIQVLIRFGTSPGDVPGMGKKAGAIEIRVFYPETQREIAMISRATKLANPGPHDVKFFTEENKLI